MADTPDAFGAGSDEDQAGPAPATVPGAEPVAPDVEEASVDLDGEVADALADEPAGDPHEWTAEQIDAVVAERDQFLEAYRRAAADFDNYRKQSQKRIADEVARSTGGFVERLLPVLDAIDAARAQSAGDDAGVEAVAGALYGLLEKEGLSRVDPVGEPFDPEVAEAVMHEPGEGEPTVSEVLRTGYVWNGRVIRAAMVKVSG